MSGETEIELRPGLLRMPSGLGEQAQGDALSIGPLLRGWAERLDTAGVEWCVLRNAADLPDFTRYDVDVLVAPNRGADAAQILEAVAAETGWRVLGRIRKRHYRCWLLARGTGGDFRFLPIDLFTALEYRGLRYLSAGAVLAGRIRTPAGIWSLPAGVEAAITLLKEWLPHGVLKENSRAVVQAQAAEDPARFQSTLAAAAGLELAARFAAAVVRGEWSLAPADARALCRAVRRRTPRWPMGLVGAALANIAHLFRPSLGCVVCLAGADGSGKTTLAEGLFRETFKRPFKACRYIHGNVGMLPRFRDIRARLGRLVEHPPPSPPPEPPVLKGMMAPLPAWKSVALATYYAFDLGLARLPLRRWRGQWSLVVMDRSFYDYYYQLGHRRCPRRFLDFLSLWIPKPDLLLCIADEPECIHARKPELTTDEIRREQEILAGLSGRLSFARRLDGAVGISGMVSEGRRIILRHLAGAGGGALRVWSLGGRPLLAYPEGDRQMARRAAALFPRTSAKRAALARLIRLAQAFHLERWFSVRSETTPGLLSADERVALLGELRQAGGGGELDWLLTWPARADRRREYLVFRAAGEHCGVVKIGAGEYNRGRFRNEAEALRKLAQRPHPFSVPTLLFEREFTDGRTLLALDGFPARLRPMAAAQAADWSARVVAHLAPLAPGGFVHGDLGPGNMFRDDADGLFLFDWENASDAAPRGTDEVAFWLALRQRRALRRPRALAGKLRTRFRDWPGPDLAAALDYLATHDNLAAQRVREVLP